MNALSITRQFLTIGIFSACLYAAPIQYSIAFNGGSPTPTAGSFTYDAVTTQFSSFLVDWHGATFDLTISANSPIGSNGCSATAAQFFAVMTGGPGACAGTNTLGWLAAITSPGQGAFAISDTGTGSGPPVVGIGNQTVSPALLTVSTSTSGSFLVTEVTQAPEPSSLVLAVGGIVLLGFTRRTRRLAN
uniref:Ice-binding protein C-terminal domain-containing protein n=1 Tax=Solibacter usitatus (strain Ellin6076) TaxID=234267 RepID=Q020Y6_SOLUE